MRILVGCPVSDYKGYCINEYADSVKNLGYKKYDILLADNSNGDLFSKRLKELGLPFIRCDYHESARERIVGSRNRLREYALDNDYDYFLSLEQDVIPPRDVIQRLLKHDRKVVSGVYFAVNFYHGKHQLLPLVWADFDEKTKRMFYLQDDRLWDGKLIEIAACGLGCVLIHRDVLNKINFRYDKNNKEGFDDVWFCKDLRENNIKLYCDTSVKCKHLIRDWSWKRIKL